MVGMPLSATQLRVYLLGCLRIELDTRPVHLPTRKIESLLAYLILHPNAHTREKLAALFWGYSSDENARGSLRKALTLIRKHIARDIVLADRECIQLNPSFPVWVDAIDFEDQARLFLADPSADLNRIDLETYQNDLLVDYYDDWILPLREHYHALLINLLLCVVEQHRTQSEYKLAIKYAQRVLAHDESNERAHQHLMFCYIALGERTKALQQYDACRCALEEELGVEPSRQTQALHKWIQQTILDLPSQAARVTNLPIPISSFVGRNREMAKIKTVLSKARLVTLTGAGGSGKTRLAIHVATDLIDVFKDGVWWVELAPLMDGSLVPSAVAKALGISENTDQPLTETLVSYLRQKQLLLVLDNCEHLIEDAAHLVESLLSACPDLKILNTSREALGSAGENVWYVPTLSLPDPQKLSYVEFLMQYESILLFVERASAVRPEFRLSEEDAGAVVQICQRLDGIPLAIELAAARVKMMSIDQIAARLDDRFQLLTTTGKTAHARHQTLRAAVDWSYDLLSEDERQLFCRLSVFAGGWTLKAAEAICSGEGLDQGGVLDLLACLVDKSLVTITADGKHFNMLETMRQYAKEKLIKAGMEDLIVERHLYYFMNLAETVDDKIRGPEQLIWFEWLEAERDNLAAGIKRSLYTPSRADAGGRLVCALCWYWYMVGDFIQIKHGLESVFHQSACLGRTATRAKVLFSAGAYSAMRVQWLEPDEACAALEESLELWCELGSKYALEAAQSLLFLGFILKRRLNKDKGIDYILESIKSLELLENHWWQAWALGLYEILVWDSIDYKSHRSTLEEQASLFDKVGDRHGKAIVLLDMGRVELDYGKFAESEEYMKRSLAIFMEFKAKGYLQNLMKRLGDVALCLKNYNQAREYYQESEQLAHMIGCERSLSVVYHSLGLAMLRNGDDRGAEKYFYQTLKINQENNYIVNLTFCLMALACLAAYREETIVAARLFGAFYGNIEALQAASVSSQKLIEPIDQLDIEHFLGLCQAQIDQATFGQAYNAGRLLSLDEAIEEILQSRRERLVLVS